MVRAMIPEAKHIDIEVDYHREAPTARARTDGRTNKRVCRQKRRARISRMIVTVMHVRHVFMFVLDRLVAMFVDVWIA